MPTRIGAEPKPPWQRVPGPVRDHVAERLGAPVRRALRVWGGYAPSPTFRLFLADGRRVFFKAVEPASNAFMHRALKTEERAYRELGVWLQPWAPAFLGSIQAADWHVLLLEDVGPASFPPWTLATVRDVMAAYAGFHRASLGAALPDWLPRTVHEHFGQTWTRLEAQPGGIEAVANLAGLDRDTARSWLESSLPRLKATAERLAAAAPPHALLHMDTRSDNLRLQPGGRLRIFDWPFVCVGPPSFDVVAFAQSITCEGGPLPEVGMEAYCAHLALDEDEVDAGMAAIAGYFALQAPQPPLPGLPRVRAIQRCQLRSSLSWCARRLGLPSPDWLERLDD